MPINQRNDATIPIAPKMKNEMERVRKRIEKVEAELEELTRRRDQLCLEAWEAGVVWERIGEAFGVHFTGAHRYARREIARRRKEGMK